ncbi:hypothetical protein GBAR_LOCUS30090 [Geodia barretti]|uniref:Transmembrane protein n=1 Tax=Geodia barretti TaxID=519541 RepID=A0AA35TWM0_GEOBA|nr:hypothetical protein GBAR_LOCUS30090 [Geodia barretti]
MEDDHGDAAGPSTYVRGYHRLPQEDIDMLSTSNWGDQTTPQNQQSPLVPLPPYSPVPGYAPAPQTFRTPQQTSSSSGCASNSGDYETAATYGKAACCCSLFSVAITLIAVLVAIIFVILIFTTGLAFLGIAKEELA